MEWSSIVIVICLIIMSVMAIIRMLIKAKEGKVTGKDIRELNEWLIYAVAKAQKEYGKDTAELKLYSVFNEALEKFPDVMKILEFDCFKLWVDDAKKTVVDMCSNEAINDYLYGVENLNEDGE